MKRGIKTLLMVAALIGTAASLRAVASPHVRKPVVRFIQFYEQSQALPDVKEMGLWDRVFYSVLMTRTAS